MSSSEITRQGDLCNLKIPNEEVFTLYQQIIEQWLSNEHGIDWYNQFIENLLNGKIEKFKVDLEKVVYQIMSYHDLANAGRALAQIEEKKYDEEFKLKSISDVIKIGIGFEGKEFALEYLIGSATKKMF